jgi:adenosylhomocysteine nucleosidase
LSIKLGIVAALPFETACFTRNKIHPGSYQFIAPGLYVYYAGMGPVNAANAAQILVDLKVDALVSWGVAGSLDPALVAGDIVLPVDVLDDDGQYFPVNRAWHTALKNRLNHQGVYAEGKLVSTHDVQQDIRLKSELHQATQAMAVDMESAAVAKVAFNANKPFVVIRTIFDTAAMHIPTSSANATDQYGQVSMLKLVTGLMRSPAELLQYPKLVSSFAKAKRSLRHVVELCGNELCFSRKL